MVRDFVSVVAVDGGNYITGGGVTWNGPISVTSSVWVDHYKCLYDVCWPVSNIRISL